MECHQQLYIQIQHMDSYKAYIGTVTHASACSSTDKCLNSQSSGTCMEVQEMQPLSQEQGILCYPVHAYKLGSDCELLACIQSRLYDHLSTAQKGGVTIQ
jgi:hypothetical protein